MANEIGGRQNAPQGGGHGGEQHHVSVLLKEAIDFLNVRPGGTYVDATVGLGGHSLEIARRLGEQGHLIGFDKDQMALDLARRRLEQAKQASTGWPQVTLHHASFAEIGKRIEAESVDGILADLGVSSMQLKDAQRGFSFQAEGPLDMRMDTASGATAEQVVNHTDEKHLAGLIYEFGEERRSRRIARAIVRARPIRTTAHLAQIISAALGTVKSGRIHPATLTFQAIRIFVNRELQDLGDLLKEAPEALKEGGRLVVISFHSLEDRIVKDAFRQGAKDGTYVLLTRRPAGATEDEVGRNPRARSAKLRAAERTRSKPQGRGKYPQHSKSGKRKNGTRA